MKSINQLQFKNYLSYCTALLIIFSLSACASLLTPKVKTELTELRAGQYTLDKAHASVVFKINHMGLSTYVGRFNEFDASLDFDPANITATKLEAVVLTQSVDVNNQTLENTLRGDEWFNVEKFPEVSFIATSFTAKSENTFLVTGNLTLLGTTKPINLIAKFNGGAVNMLTAKYTLGFEANTTIKRSDFGLDKYIPLVGDEVVLEIYAEFQKR